MKKLNVLYTTNHTYLKHMLISIYSLLEHNKDIDVSFHIICDNFELTDYQLIDKIIKIFPNADICFYQFDEINKLIEKYKIPTWRGTKIASARLFFTTCIKDIDKILYLDSDTIVVNSLNKLEEYQQTLHMVEDLMPKTYWQNLAIPLEKYCNSGLLWIDVDKWHKEDCDKKICDILTENIEYTFPDQDILNMALKDNIELLPPEYNLFSTDMYFNKTFLNMYYKEAQIERYTKEEIQNAKDNPIVLHTTPFYNWKVWEDNNIHPYFQIYDEYLFKIFGEIDKEKGLENPNPILFKLYLYSKMACPKQIKETVKKLIKY